MNMKLYQFTENDINDTATSGMYVGIRALVSDGLLTEEQAVAFLNNHAVTISTKTNWLRGIWAKLAKTDPTLDPGSFAFHCVKIMDVK
jgi:hypothetical protein